MPHSKNLKVFCFGLFLAVLGILLNALPTVASTVKITRITPSGTDVPAGRQIVFQFDRPMVPLGAMSRKSSEIPITIVPELQCQWRWLNTQTLGCQLNEKEALLPATQYDITVRPGLKALDGSALEKPVRHQFTTMRPKIRNAWLKKWQAPGMPLIRLTFNQPVFKSSVAKCVYLTDKKRSSKPIAVSVFPDPDIKEKPLENQAKYPGKTARRVWLVSPNRELPSDTEITLRVRPGLASFKGPEKGNEKRVLVSFATFPQFTFKGVECTDNRGKSVLILPNASEPLEKRCNPLRQAALVFSSPVISEEVRDHVPFNPDLKGGRTDYDPWDGVTGYSQLTGPHKKGQTYRVWIPELLKAHQKYHIQSDPGTLRDEFGRKLENALNMTFATDHRLPNFVLTHQQAVLEKGVDSQVPLVVTNLEKVNILYNTLTPHEKKTGQSREISIPNVEDIAFNVPLGTREMLANSSGVVQGTVHTTPNVKKTPWESWFMAQVTPFQAHVKIGHYNTLVWVTNLATGKPVAGARVSLYRDTYQALPQSPNRLTHGITNDKGVVMLAGTALIDPLLTTLESYGMKKPHLFARIEKGSDMALLPLDGPFRVDTWQASGNTLWPQMQPRYGHMHTWGTTAQGVYRAGDTIQYKLYVRNQDNDTFVPPPLSGYDLKILDPTGKMVHEVKNITLSEFGAHHGVFQVPKTGAVGWYRFVLSAGFAKWEREPMRVLVSDFTPSPFKVFTDLNGDFFGPGQSIEITTKARLHAGGPYVDAPDRVTAVLQTHPLRLSKSTLQNFTFDTRLPKAPPREPLYQTEKQLNRNGEAVCRFSVGDTQILYGRLTVESAVRDDRGKSIAGRAHADFAARDRFVGIRRLAWTMEAGKPANVELLVVDGRKTTVSNTPIKVTLSRRETKAARVKGAGNAYVTHYTHQWVLVSEQTVTSALKPVKCILTPEKPGSHRITATIKDTHGRIHATRILHWAVGKGRVVWEESPDNRLTLIPEKDVFEVGEQARYLIKNPFPGAMALVSIERYGILKHWVQPLEGSTPTIEFQVEPDFLPGFYLSVVVISPRVEQPPLKPGDVDLGKPCFRMGYVKARVTDPHNQMVVTVTPERETYKPRERVKVKLKAVPRNMYGRKIYRPYPVEMAVVVLDESVFDLISGGLDYFDPYKGFYTLDGLDLQNFSLLMGLVGRQKFEKKGANTGGGGGTDISLRSLFKFVSYWNPSIRPDETGEAVISFDAPDNLTGWRVLAMAVTPGNQMGLGDGTFKVNQPTEIRPVMPNQVTAGDRFEAGFSIMNRTAQNRHLTVTLTARGPVKTSEHENILKKSVQILLPPYKREVVWLPVDTTASGKILFTAKAWDDTDGDGLTHTLTVQKSYTLETAADYGSTTKAFVTRALQFPKEMRTDVGSVTLNLSPTVLGNLEGAFQYLRDYPYTCWEQALTKAVMAMQYTRLKPYLPDGFSWPKAQNLPVETLGRAADFQAPSGGMTYFVPEDRYVSPYLSAYTALAFTWLSKAGYKIPVAVENNLHKYLQTLLRRNVLPDFYSKGMASTVRAVALAALSREGLIDRNDLERYAPHTKEMSLFGKAQFLMAALSVPHTEKIRNHTLDQILSHADESGGKIVFSETVDDGYSRILASPLRTSGTILSALSALAKTPEYQKKTGDLPFKLVRFITETRGQRDHWENTQENVFCMKGLVDYAGIYENENPNMTVRAFYNEAILGETRFSAFKDTPASFTRKTQNEDPGQTAAIRIDREGRGRLYFTTRLAYAPLSTGTSPVNAGMEIHREYSIQKGEKWVLLQNPLHLDRGDLVRVDLYLSLPAARNFVVVNDPIPGGLEPVNRDLATASTIDADQGDFEAAGGSWWFKFRDWFSYGVSRWSFYHKELRHNAARFYSEYLPAGNYHLSYTAQVIAPGDFTVLPVHAEEMYDPNVFGKGIADQLVVRKNQAAMPP